MIKYYTDDEINQKSKIELSAQTSPYTILSTSSQEIEVESKPRI